jgi:hypothetical protein
MSSQGPTPRLLQDALERSLQRTPDSALAIATPGTVWIPRPGPATLLGQPGQIASSLRRARSGSRGRS